MTVATVLGIAITYAVTDSPVPAFATKIGKVSMESDKPKRESQPNDVGSAWEDQTTPRPTISQKIRQWVKKNSK
jgi:hypothetical protein